jgi:hypothetical protein
MFRLLLLLLMQSCLNADEVYPKCCDSDSVLEKSNSSYSCTPDLTHRTQIIANETNLVARSEEGFCVDVENSVSLFKLNGTEVIKVKEVEVEFYPKCCPVDYFYNSTTHGCVKSTKKLDTFFREKFVRVGLPACRIIEDVRVNTIKRWNESLQLVQNKVFDEGLYCVDKDQDNLFVARACRDNYDICERIRCVHKCCPDGQSFINGSKCYDTFVHGLDLSSFAGNVDNINASFVVVHGYAPPLYSLQPHRFHFHLDDEGMFIMTEIDEGKVNVTKHYTVDQSVYCIEHALKKTMNSFYFFRGFPEQTQTKFLYTRVAMAISCVFLMLTILYYCCSNEKQTVFGKTLISYCTASFMAFLVLCYLAFDDTRPEAGSPICTGLAFFLLYSTLTIFTWMNVMCIDIYWTFGSSKSFSSRQHRSKELKRFVLYSLYAWGSPLVVTAIPLIFYHLDVLPPSIQVIINEKKCLLYKGDGNYAQFLFSTMALALLEICNLILFVRTTIYCLKVKREISKMNDTHALKGERRQKLNKFRDRFGLLLKLFLIMGVSFLFEVVSTFFDFKKNSTTAVVETIWDTFNCLQGLFIFVIFLVKRRILKKFEQKVGLTRLRKFSLVSSAMTQTSSLPTISKQ